MYAIAGGNTGYAVLVAIDGLARSAMGEGFAFWLTGWGFRPKMYE